MPGIATSQVEIVQVTRFGIWLASGDEEFWLDYRQYPWFQSTTTDAVCDVTEPSPGHYYWPRLDVDLEIEGLRNPENYPLIAK
ncbi:MAG: DUF2442 domain-containing protein [Rectinemataceae bacterium]